MLIHNFHKEVLVTKPISAAGIILHRCVLNLFYRFNSFHLDVSSSCFGDYVAVYDGPNIASPLLGKFCGAILPSPIKSSSNNLLLIFRTDAFGAADGWEASFRETIGKIIFI